MNLVKSVFNLANSFMKYPRDVEKISDHFFYILVEKIQNTPVPAWPKKEIKNPELEILSTLIKNSINYCYWYGRYDVRPNDSCASKLGKIVGKHMEPDKPFINVLGNIKRDIILNRFPLISERLKHLDEIAQHGMEFSIKVCDNHNEPAEKLMEGLIQYFPGYGSDLFLKRASLFFIELYRTFGWFKEDTRTLFIPADYQLPKLLSSFSVLEYSYDLIGKIKSHQLIPKNSITECEIRAATIIACDRLSKATGINIADIDSWLWLNRDSIDTPFHLTITTDY